MYLEIALHVVGKEPHAGLHIPSLKLIFGHPEWREMKEALY